MLYSPYSAISGLVSLACSAFWIVLLVAFVLFTVRLFSTNRFSEDSVIERWSAMLPGQAPRAADYLSMVEKALHESRLPFSVGRESIPVSLTSGEKYDFITCEMNSDYSVFVSCIPAGDDLEVSWLVQDHMIRGIYRTPVLGPLLLSVMKRYTFANGNKVRAFAAATHNCAISAAEDLLDEARADKSRMNRKTSGRLGPL
jgi:hypothetical protein